MKKVKGAVEYGKLSAAIFLLVLIVMRQFIFYGHDFLFDGVLSDLLRANYPVYCNLYDNLAQGWSFWSWNMGIGTSVLTHADVIFDPFTYIIFLFGKEHIAGMMIWSLVIKIICEGVSIAVYLNYFKFNSRAVLIASVCYAFTGYSLIMGSNLALGTILVIFPVILIGIEKLLNEQKITVLFFSLLLTCILSYYFFYVSGILTVIYLTARSVYEKKQCSRIIVYLMILAVTAAAVMGLAGCILLPQLDIVRNSARMQPIGAEKFGELFLPEFGMLITAILRLFANDILGNMVVDDYFGGMRDYFQASTYTSALCIILAFQVRHLITDKQKKMLKWSAILTAAAILFPFFSFVCNAFSTVNYRWMFFVNLLITVYLAFCLDLFFDKGGGTWDKNALWLGICVTYAVILSGIIVYAGMVFENHYFETLLRIFGAGRKSIGIFTCEIGIVIIICYVSQNSHTCILKKRTEKLLWIVLLAVEIPGNYSAWFQEEAGIWNYEGDQGKAFEDESAAVIQRIRQQDIGFYRIHKSFDSVYDQNGIPSDNDAMVQQYYGLKSYCPVNNRNYITFLQNMGIYVCNPLSLNSLIESEIKPEEVRGQELNYINGVGKDDYPLMSYLGVKYYLSYDESEKIPDYFKLSDQFSTDRIRVYENKWYFPLAFINESEVSLDSFMQLEKEEKTMVLMANTLVESNQGTAHDLRVTGISVKEKQEAFRLISFANDEIEFEIKNDIAGESWISFLMPYDKDWNAYIDGVETVTEKINISLLGAKIQGGTHRVKLRYRPRWVYAGLKISIGTFLLWIGIVIIGKRKNVTAAQIIDRMHEKTSKLPLISVSDALKRQICITAVLVGIIFGVTACTVFIRRCNLYMIRMKNYESKNDWNEYAAMEVKEDALEINLTDPFAKENAPHRVICTDTENLPQDCDLGIEFVYFYDSNNITIQVIGRDRQNQPRIWIRQYTNASGWSDYYSIKKTDLFTDSSKKR